MRNPHKIEYKTYNITQKQFLLFCRARYDEGPLLWQHSFGMTKPIEQSTLNWKVNEGQTEN